jgi:hypothetical protein
VIIVATIFYSQVSTLLSRGKERRCPSPTPSSFLCILFDILA